MALKELGEYRSGKRGTTDNLSPAIQQAIEVEKQGGDLSEHFRRVGMDFEKMDGSEVLRQKFFKDNAKLHKSNPKLAQMKHERGLNEKYGLYLQFAKLTDEAEKADFADEHGEDNIEYEKMLFENDIADAKDELTEWQKSAKPTASGQGGLLSDEDAQRIYDEYQPKAAEAFKEFKSLSIPMGENAKDYALGLNDKTRPMVEEWVKKPYEFLKAIGFDNESIDIDALLPVMTLVAEANNETLGPRIKKFVIDNADAQTLDNKLDKPTTTTVTTPPDDQDKDLWEQVGDEAEKREKELYGDR